MGLEGWWYKVKMVLEAAVSLARVTLSPSSVPANEMAAGLCLGEMLFYGRQ